MIENQKLLEWNRRGIIPGPEEKEKAFLKRVERIECRLPIADEIPIEIEAWKNSHLITTQFFDIAPDWINGFYSNRKLPFWQGAAMWTVEDTDLPAIQLSLSFRKPSPLSLYKKDEVLAHESVHAARAAFHEPKFEEILAYATSRNSFRRFWGPLFRTSFESYVFVVLLIISLSAQVAGVFWDQSVILDALFATPLFFLGYLTLRLCYMQTLFRRAHKRVEDLIQHKRYGLAVLLRLTDWEITFFARCSEQEGKEYILKHREDSLRVRVVADSYF